MGFVVVQSLSWVQLSFQFSRSVMSDSLRPRGLQHARPPSPSPAPRVYSNSCPLSQWCHPTISSSVVFLSSCLRSFPSSGSFQMSQFFTSGGQTIGVLTLCNPINCSTQGSSALHCLPEFAQIHARYINHLILCRPLLLLPASGSSFPVNIQGWFPLELTGLILQSPRDSQESSAATQFESINSSMLSLLYGLPTQ